MKGAWVIAWRDLRGYFGGVGFYVISALVTAFLGLTYATNLRELANRSAYQGLSHGSGDVNVHQSLFIQHISSLNLLLLFLVPFLTARLLSEERKTRTMDLLLTSPVASWQIVLGKMIAGCCVSWMLVALSFIYPLVTARFVEGGLEWKLLLSSYGGMMLLAGAYVAVGLFASSLTESMVLSGVVAIVLSLFLWFVAWTASLIDQPTLRDVMNHVAVVTHFRNLATGSLQTVSLIFFFSLIFFYGFLTERVVESARWR